MSANVHAEIHACRYVDPVGKNDGSVKGVRLFTCHPNHGHILRPDKVAVLSQEAAEALHKRSNKRNVLLCASSLGDLRIGSPPSRGHSSAVTGRASPSGVAHAASDGLTPSGGLIPCGVSKGPSPVVSGDLQTNTSAQSPGRFNPDKLQHGDPGAVIGSDQRIDEVLPRNRVGLVYDERMGSHRATAYHPEQPARIRAVFCRLEQTGLAQRCVRVPARPATPSELQGVHARDHVQCMMDCHGKDQEELDSMCAKMDSVYMCPESTSAALLAAGSVIEATKRVCTNVIKRAACVVSLSS